jgi:hypothetical protein
MSTAVAPPPSHALTIAKSLTPPPRKRDIVAAMVTRYHDELVAESAALSAEFKSIEAEERLMMTRLHAAVLSKRDQERLALVTGCDPTQVQARFRIINKVPHVGADVSYPRGNEQYQGCSGDRSTMHLPWRSMDEVNPKARALADQLRALDAKRERLKERRAELREERIKARVSEFRSRAMGTTCGDRVQAILDNPEAVVAIDAMRKQILQATTPAEPKPAEVVNA